MTLRTEASETGTTVLIGLHGRIEIDIPRGGTVELARPRVASERCVISTRDAKGGLVNSVVIDAKTGTPILRPT